MSKKKQAANHFVPTATTVINDRELAPKTKQRQISTKPITFHIQLTEEQKLAKATIIENVVTFLKGKPGTAKSTLACNAALDRLIKGHVDKILITRPTVEASDTQGYQPGDSFDPYTGKMAPFISPLLETMYKLRSKDEIDNMIKKEQIQIQPINFVRGKNFENVFVIVDESQNLKVDELKALTTRICNNSWMVFTSDVNQIDLRWKGDSSAHFVNAISELKDVGMVELTENFRHPLALAIMDVIDQEVYNKKNEVLKSKETAKIAGE